MEYETHTEAAAVADRINAETSIQRITYGWGRIVWQVLVVDQDRFIVWNGESK